MTIQEKLDEIFARLAKCQMTMDQTDAPLEIDRDQVMRFYLPLAENLQSRLPASGRLVVGVAGPPGSGKSAFAALLGAVLNALPGGKEAAVVGLDGWHYPNAYLESHFVEREGRRLPLRTFKGSPPSFDALAALDCMREIRLGGEVSYPVYSRILHDPQPGGGKVEYGHHMVIVEGNFLLLDEEPWSNFEEVLDTAIFLKASLEVCLAGLLERHRRTGKDEQAARQQIEVVDIPNVRHILANSREAEFTVEKKDPRFICRIIRRGEIIAA